MRPHYNCNIYIYTYMYSHLWIDFHRITTLHCPVSWVCRIHWLHLCRGVRPPPLNECPGYDTKQSDGEVPAVLELWEMRSTPSLPSLPGPLWPGVVAPDRAPIYGLNRTNCILMLNWNVWIRTIQFTQTVLIQTIQFSISMQLVLFNP